MVNKRALVNTDDLSDSIRDGKFLDQFSEYFNYLLVSMVKRLMVA
jgi:hypothetical protein